MEKKKWSGAERRVLPRLKDIIFIFGKLRSNSIEEFKAFTRDIGAGGLMFETDRDIPLESELDLEIYQPMNRCKKTIFSIPVLAKVIWIKNIEKEIFEKGENKYRVGIEFAEIKEEDRKRIAKYIEESTVEI